MHDKGEHFIEVDHSIIGPTCGLLPVGISSTILSTTGLEWNLGKFLTNSEIPSYRSSLLDFMDFIDEAESSFDGMVSTSNALVPSEKNVWIKTTQPIWWTVALRPLDDYTL